MVDAIVEAARRVVADVGWSQAKVARIAKVAGVSVGSLYRYFPGRDVLLRALIDRSLQSDYEAFMAALDKARGETFEQSLEAFADALLVEGRLTDPELLRELINVLEAAGRLEAVQRRFDEMIDAFATRIVAQHPQLGPRALVHRRCHILFWGTRGAFVARVRVEDPFDLDAFRRDALQLALGLLTSSEGSAR